MIDPAGNVKLMDFGIARSLFALGHTATLVGTPAYMSPEQAEGQPFIDYRADIYSLGLILYEVLTGVPAFQGESPVEIALRQVRDPPRRPRELDPTLPLELEEIILRAVEKEPALRFQSVAELAAALRLVSSALAPETPGPATGSRSPVSSFRVSSLLTRTNVIAVTVVATLLIVGILMQQPQPRPSSDASPVDLAAGGGQAQLADSETRPPERQPGTAVGSAATDAGTRAAPRPIPITADLAAGFYLRLGSFARQDEALQQANQLQRFGYPPVVVPRRKVLSLWRTSYEVRVGPYARAQAAEDRKQRLGRLGFNNIAVVEQRPAR
jgi:serine/threonine-protein kinase